MAEVAVAKKNRTLSKGKFTRSKNSLLAAVEQKVTLVTIRSRYEKFKESWIQVQTAYEHYLEFVVDDEEEELKWIDDISEEFDRTEIIVDNYIEDTEYIAELKDREEVVEAEKTLNEQRMQLARLKESESFMSSRTQQGLKLRIISDEIIALMGNPEADPIHTATAVKGLVKNLEEAMNKCCDAHERYLNSIDEKEIKQSQETKWITETMDIYNKINTRCMIFVSKNEKPEKSTVQREKGTSEAFRLEKLRFDLFEGDIRKYPRFKEQFLAFIKPQYRPEEEAFVLRSYLNSSIKEEVEGIGEDAKEIWERLDKKYGDKYKLVDAIMAEIKGMKANNEQAEQKLKMISTIERAHRDLTYLKKENEMNNAIIISIIEEKMPDEMKQEWIKLVNGERRGEIRRDK